MPKNSRLARIRKEIRENILYGLRQLLTSGQETYNGGDFQVDVDEKAGIAYYTGPHGAWRCNLLGEGEDKRLGSLIPCDDIALSYVTARTQKD